MEKPRSVKFSRRAIRALDKIEPRFSARIKEAIRAISSNPLLGKRLKGEFEGLLSYRIGSFRIVYRFTRDRLEVVYIEDRKDIYR